MHTSDVASDSGDHWHLHDNKPECSHGYLPGHDAEYESHRSHSNAGLLVPPPPSSFLWAIVLWKCCQRWKEMETGLRAYSHASSSFRLCLGSSTLSNCECESQHASMLTMAMLRLCSDGKHIRFVSYVKFLRQIPHTVFCLWSHQICLSSHYLR